MNKTPSSEEIINAAETLIKYSQFYFHKKPKKYNKAIESMFKLIKLMEQGKYDKVFRKEDME